MKLLGKKSRISNVISLTNTVISEQTTGERIVFILLAYNKISYNTDAKKYTEKNIFETPIYFIIRSNAKRSFRFSLNGFKISVNETKE